MSNRYVAWWVKEETQDKIDAFVRQWPGSDYGPAHIALGDINIDDECLNLCLEWVQGELDGTSERSRDELLATKAFLQELLAIPEDDR